MLLPRAVEENLFSKTACTWLGVSPEQFG